ncbi:MAG: DUF177 domain-containing protein [Bacteroidales bacterium]|nr:DUF177 domain-containing protein [Bacteroidales bacterium]
MDVLKEYVIPFRGLAIGEHLSHFDIGEPFFSCFERSEIRKGSLRLELLLERQERLLILDFRLAGTVRVMCDRCLEEMDWPLEINRRMFIKFGEAYREESEEIIIIPEQQFQVDISQWVYEFIILALPIRKVHPDLETGEPGCSAEAVNLLNRYRKNRLPDTRWDSLRDIQNDKP